MKTAQIVTNHFESLGDHLVSFSVNCSSGYDEGPQLHWQASSGAILSIEVAEDFVRRLSAEIAAAKAARDAARASAETTTTVEA